MTCGPQTMALGGYYPPLPGPIGTWLRQRAGSTDRDCLRLFGVGLSTIERIAAGEVIPEPEIAAAIAKVVVGFGPSRPAFETRAGHLAGAAVRGGAGPLSGPAL